MSTDSDLVLLKACKRLSDFPYATDLLSSLKSENPKNNDALSPRLGLSEEISLVCVCVFSTGD